MTLPFRLFEIRRSAITSSTALHAFSPACTLRRTFLSVFPSLHTAPPRYTKLSRWFSIFPSSSMSSSSLWWPMCSTSVFSRFSFSPCLINKPFHSSIVSCSSSVCHSSPEPGRLHREVSSWHPSPPSSCWWGPVLLWTAAGSTRCPASVHSWPLTPPKLLLPPPLLLLSSRTYPQPSSLPLPVLLSTVVSPSPSLWVLCQKLSLGRRTPEPYFPVPSVSSLPSVSGRTSRLMFLPFLNPCCSSPKSPSTLLLILASKTLSNSFNTWLSSVMPLYFPGSCTSPFLFHIGTIRPILHSFGILPSCIHTFSSLPVHLTHTSPAISNITSRTSSAPVALPFFILGIAVCIWRVWSQNAINAMYPCYISHFSNQWKWD